jgi:hypothetical protein
MTFAKKSMYKTTATKPFIANQLKYSNITSPLLTVKNSTAPPNNIVSARQKLA